MMLGSEKAITRTFCLLVSRLSGHYGSTDAVVTTCTTFFSGSHAPINLPSDFNAFAVYCLHV